MKICLLFIEFMRQEHGTIMILAAASMMAVLGMAALAIDVGYVLAARNQLQSGIDASALAGATGLRVSQSLAAARATDFAARNTCLQQPIVVGAGDVSFPSSTRIRVRCNRQVPLFFAPAVGLRSMTINATAIAEIGTIIATDRLRPWAVPDENFGIGDLVLLKIGSPGNHVKGSSFFNAIDYPPVNRGTPIIGGNQYEDNIANGCAGVVRIGDILQEEPGSMEGPTERGVEMLIKTDKQASWDNQSMSVMNSSYPGAKSPRIVILPLYDKDLPPDNGRSTVTVTKLAAFFLEAKKGKDLYGRFITIMNYGTRGGGSSDLYGVHLVE